MAYPGNYSELSNTQKIIWLKKQRKGAIIGDFRNCLYSVYEHIRVSCSESDIQSCVYEDIFSGTKIAGVYNPFDYCLELCSLGYVEIQLADSLHILSVLKAIDF